MRATGSGAPPKRPTKNGTAAGKKVPLALRGIEPRLLLTVQEVAVLLGFGRSKVQALVQRGDMPSIKIGKWRRVSRAALDAWIAEQVERSTAEAKASYTSLTPRTKRY